MDGPFKNDITKVFICYYNRLCYINTGIREATTSRENDQRD